MPAWRSSLATGRRYDFARPIFEQLPAPLTLILSNGAIVKTRTGETLMRDLLPRDVARAVLDRVPQHRDSAAVIFDRPREGQVVFEAIDWHHPRHERFFASNRPFLLEISPLEACLTEDPIQVMFTGRCGEMRELFDQLRAEREGVLRGVDEYAASRFLPRRRRPHRVLERNRARAAGGARGDSRAPKSWRWETI